MDRICYALLTLFISTTTCADSSNLAAQTAGYIAPVVLSTDSLVRDARLFQPWFDNDRWDGDLIAFALDAHTGQTAERQWSAASELLARDWRDRLIITRRDDNDQTVAFDNLSDLSPAQQLALGDQARLDYLRGDDGAEGLQFRTRSHTDSEGRRVRNIFGAPVHANPVYVPSGDSGQIYIGANDGMLHCFDAATGHENFAYVPGMIYQRLASSAEPDSTGHPVYTVDGAIALAQLRFSNGSTHTLLAGGLGAGGQGLFALDISAAALDTEAAALGAVLWELDDSDEAALGHTTGAPQFVSLDDGRHALLVGNGYANTEPDDHTGTGTAQLLIIDAESGTVIRRIDTNAGSAADSNGLSTPRAIDADADGRVDYVYAGDLHGNLWRFDLRGASSGWGVSFNGSPLYSTRDSAGTRQAITAAPAIIAHPDRGVRVLFGTGRLLSDADLDSVTGAGVNTVYGVRDRLDSTLPDITKTQQRALAERQYPDGQRVRVLGFASGESDNDIWRVDLASGERVLTDPLLDSGRLTISVAQPLNPSGEVWLLELDAQRGTAPAQIAFDMSNDGVLDAHDTLSAEGAEITPEDLIVGRFYGTGVGSGPVIANLSATRRVTYINRKEPAQTTTSTCTTDCGTSDGNDDDPILDADTGGTVTNDGSIASDTGAVLMPPAPCGEQDCMMEPRTNPGRIDWKELLAP